MSPVRREEAEPLHPTGFPITYAHRNGALEDAVDGEDFHEVGDGVFAGGVHAGEGFVDAQLGVREQLDQA